MRKVCSHVNTWAYLCAGFAIVWAIKPMSRQQESKTEKKRKYLRYFVPSCGAFMPNVLMKRSASGVASKLSLVWCYVVEKKEIPWGCIIYMALPCLKLHISQSERSKGYTIKNRIVSLLKCNKIMFFLCSIEAQISSISCILVYFDSYLKCNSWN